MACDAHKIFQAGETMMEVKKISFAYGRKEVLKDVSLNITAGRLLGLLGPNGSGKTTLFKCCLGFLKVKSGRIMLGDKNLSDYSARRLAAHVAYVPQEHKPVFPFLVREMVEMGRTPHRGVPPVSSKGDRLAVERALERVGLRDLAEENFIHLSAGQRQLVLVARALAQQASLMFLDEPTSSLDFSNQLTVWETVRDIAAEGLAVVICCHDPNHILWFCDEVAALKEGRILASGPAQSVIRRKLLEEIYSRPINTELIGERTFIYP
ncbi:MAG: ABC transporter ATP-binding protein [Deltaproteobacteria bacterium]|jgi:iron complex transport system ATP-binding protein|nr:ABC transporter ATP-binding protein [Deltaproteobacteria bacterium]